jgi:hypothetical protein
MKTRIFLNAIGVCSLMAGFSAQAALLNLGQNSSSPFYSDFTANGLDVNYVYTGTSSSGTGTFTASDPYSGGSLQTEDEGYTSSSESPGTFGAYNHTPFTGSYSITADISYNNGVATLTSGTFSIYGGLPGIPGSTSSTLLLSGNLVAGGGGSAFGYVDNSAGLTQGKYDEFDFLINLSSVTGNSEIEADFLKSLGGEAGIILHADFDATGHTAIVNHVPTTIYNYNNGSTTTTANSTSTTYAGFDGNWNQSFANPVAEGNADTFVPEPAMYSGAASIAALTGAIFIRRRSDNSGRREDAAKKA